MFAVSIRTMKCIVEYNLFKIHLQAVLKSLTALAKNTSDNIINIEMAYHPWKPNYMSTWIVPLKSCETDNFITAKLRIYN